MWKDPIVEEVRKAGEELSAESGGNIKVFFSNLRIRQEKYAEHLAAKIPLRVRKVKHKEKFLAA